MTDSLAKAIIAGSGFTEHEIQQLCHHWLTSRAELDQLRQRAVEVDAELVSTRDDRETYAIENDELRAKLSLAARRWQIARKIAVWSPWFNGHVRWVITLPMDEPAIGAASLTSDSVAQCFDAAIDASGESSA